MMLSTEQILTHPDGFGLTTATPLQLALCRVLDGRPLGPLAKRADVIEALGAVTKLPKGAPAFEVHVLAAIRTAKSMIAAAKIINWSQSVDVSGLSRGDIARILLVALKLDGTAAVMTHLVENVRAKPMLRHLLIGEPTQAGITLKHPSGRPIEVTPIPLDRAGGSALSVWNAGIIFDEEPRMVGADDGVKNWDHVRQAVLGRVLRGGQVLGIGSPWAPFGPIYNLVQEHGGRPSRDLVVFRAPGPAMNPTWWTPERCDNLRRRDMTAYRTDVLAEFADAEASLISADEVEANTRSTPKVLPATPGLRYVAAMDPGTRSNSWTLVIVEVREAGAVPRFSVARAVQWTGRRNAPLSPQNTLREIAAECERYAVRRVGTDQYSVDAIRDLAAQVGLRLDEHVVTGELKLELYDGLRFMISSGQIEFAPEPQLRADLLSIRKRVTQSGVTIELPHSSDGRHADYAPSVALAAWLAARKGKRATQAHTPTPAWRPMPDIDHLNAGGGYGGEVDDIYAATSGRR